MIAALKVENKSKARRDTELELMKHERDWLSMAKEKLGKNQLIRLLMYGKVLKLSYTEQNMSEIYIIECQIHLHKKSLREISS